MQWLVSLRSFFLDIQGEENTKKQGVSQGFSGHRKLGSILGPDSAEHPLKPWYKTQNRAKRFNKLDHPKLLRDQGVGGSNPLSPTNSFSNFQSWLPAGAPKGAPILC